ncbi:MAG TPA: ABC transporter ATP-binding protein [Desulfomonilaceae bacterium]|nr:ABC transporter ATP-binding protein [Desulfomonilaceae bacterium]
MSSESRPRETTEPVGTSPTTLDGQGIAISARELGKCYSIYDKPRDKLKEVLSFGRRNYHRDFWALRDICFDIKRGETLGIVGRNGSGKSTLLQILCGTLAPTVGTVEIRGRVSALLELGSGFNPEFTGKENVYMNATILGLSKEEIDAKYHAIVEFADIADFIDQPVKTYSTGMVVRLGFAVAVNVDAEILAVDEVLAVGDVGFAHKCMRSMEKFRESGTLLFVSHDTSAILSLCDRAILLDHGKAAAQGSARDVCDLYLEHLFASRQNVKGTRTDSATESPGGPVDEKDFVDQRLKYINYSQYRNDIRVLPFNEDSGAFGAGGAHIVDVKLSDASSGLPLTWTVGGEEVVLVIRVRSEIDLEKPLVGFYFRDRLGQYLFGDNTYLTYLSEPPSIKANRSFEARFNFRMPTLPSGDYSVTVGVVNGSMQDHVALHWLHDCLFLKSHSSSTYTGLVGIPMRHISLREIDGEAAG